MTGGRPGQEILEGYELSGCDHLVKGIMLVIIAVVILVILLSAAERLRRAAVVRRRRREAETRLGAAMRETEKRLEQEQAKADQAAALTSVVPAIQKPKTRHVA